MRGLLSLLVFYLFVWGAGQESANGPSGSASSSRLGLGGALGNTNQPTTSPPGPPLTTAGSLVPNNGPSTFVDWTPFFPQPVQPTVTSILVRFSENMRFRLIELCVFFQCLLEVKKVD